MTITTLKSSPHLYNQTIKLIEDAFHYESPNRFFIDFAPLVSKENLHHCYIKIDQDENVIAHIGVCKKEILGHSIAMLGGIAVDKQHRGKGYFQELLQEVMAEHRSDVAFFLLWSDQVKLYQKHGFYLCGNQFEIEKNQSLIKDENTFYPTKLNLLTSNEREQLKALYQNSFAKDYLTLTRTDTDWIHLSQISSSELYLKKDGDLIVSYFFMNKGQDLEGIIYEYATTEKIEAMINEISAYGKVWLGRKLNETSQLQYQFFLAPGATTLFLNFIKDFTQEKILIREINPLKQEVYFYFNQELLSLETEEFLQGVFGPGVFEEIEDQTTPIFISGLESI